jgi:hypothetical protein
MIKEIFTKYDINVEIDNFIITYTDSNIHDTLRLFFNIKNKDEVLIQNKAAIDKFMTGLLDNFVEHGLFTQDDKIYQIISDNINIHMVELIKKSLDYSKIMFDILYRWLYNLSNSIKTVNMLLDAINK